MSFYSKIRGTVESLFQLGLDGPQLKRNVSVIEARDATDAAFAIVRAAEPTSGLGTGSDAEVLPQRAAQLNFHRTFLLMGG